MTNIELLQKILVNYKKLPKVSVTLPRIRGRKEQLEVLWHDCRRIHARIMVVANAEDKDTKTYFLKDEFNKAANTYEETADFLNDAIAKFDEEETGVFDRSNATSGREASIGNSVHLPRISLPQFAGEYTHKGG